jgi:phage FluMu protein Com
MAFRTRCPSCGTLFSAPDEMIRMEIKCPRCKSPFLAEEEAGARGPESSLLQEVQQPTVTPTLFCKVCGTGFVEEDILDGIAVRRFDEVYCRKHFLENFPNECEKHPGSKAVAYCARCRMPLCENCVIELQNEKLCNRCKNRVLGELRGDYMPGEPIGFGRPGLPWEQSGRSFPGNMVETVIKVLFSPGRAFESMRLRGGYGRPLLYNWLLTVIGALMSVVWVLLIFSSLQTEFPGFPEGATEAVAGGMIGAFVFALVFALIIPFITAAIFHVSLLLVGGAKQDYECTFRVAAYAGGSMTVLNLLPFGWIPILGPLWSLAVLIWVIIVTITGLSRAHGITGGRAALAFFLPFLLCCGIYIALMAVVFSAARF